MPAMVRLGTGRAREGCSSTSWPPATTAGVDAAADRFAALLRRDRPVPPAVTASARYGGLPA